MKAKLSLQINGILKASAFYCRALPLWTLHADRGAVSITVPQWFDASDPARLMSGRSPQLASVVSLQPSAASARLQNPTNRQYLHSLEPTSEHHACNAPDSNPTRGVDKCLASLIRTAGTIRDEWCEMVSGSHTNICLLSHLQ